MARTSPDQCARADTNKTESSEDTLKVRDQLSHTTMAMAEQYIRNRRGKKVTPTQ